MRGHGKGAVFALALFVAISGCTGGSSATDTGPEGTSVIQATDDPNAGSGILSGLVVTDALEPIQGAQAALEGVVGQATSDETGRFRYTNLAGGAYKLFTGRLGYTSDARVVTIVDGQELEVTITLEAIALDTEPRSHLDIFKGFMPCGFGLVAVVVTASCPLGDYSVYKDWEATNDVLTIIDEMVWQQSSAASAQRLRVTMGKDETCNPCSYKYAYGTATGTSPVTLRADSDFDGITGEGDPGDAFKVRHRVWTPGSQPPGIPIVVLQQAFEIYTTAYYVEPAPDGASSLPDA